MPPFPTTPLQSSVSPGRRFEPTATWLVNSKSKFIWIPPMIPIQLPPVYPLIANCSHPVIKHFFCPINFPFLFKVGFPVSITLTVKWSSLFFFPF